MVRLLSICSLIFIWNVVYYENIKSKRGDVALNMIVVWAAAAAVFIVIELITYGIASIWFALGALCALAAAVLGAPPWLQIVWFAIITAVTLLLTRPLVRKYINGRAQPTNADRVIGMEGVAVEAVDNLNGAGAVRVDGKVWSALSAGGETIPAGAAVLVRAIRGVRLVVTPAAPLPARAESAEAPRAEDRGAEETSAVTPSIAEAAAAAAEALAMGPDGAEAANDDLDE